MAFLAPAVRWPDVLGIDVKSGIASVQPYLPSPFSQMSPDLFFSLCISISVITIALLISSILQARHPQTTATAIKVAQRRRKRQESPVTLLVGPCGSGKTAIFTALAFNAVPSSHPSQRESEAQVVIKNKLDTSKIVLIDTPGHPRIKDGIIANHLSEANTLVFCIDAKEALRGSAATSTSAIAKEGSLIEAVDQLHQVLIQLSRIRRRSKTPPPSLLILFTRSDLSPHLSNSSLQSSTNEDDKRRQILLNRARNAVEIELGRRRIGMGFGSKKSTKVGNLSEVIGGETRLSIWSTFKNLLGLQSNRSTIHSDNDDDNDDDGLIDYVDWDLLDRNQQNGTNLERLDPDVIDQGKARFAFASIGKERGWQERSIDGLDELQSILLEIGN